MKIPIVDDETLLRKTLQAQIESEGGHQVYTAASVSEALEIREDTIVDVVLSDGSELETKMIEVALKKSGSESAAAKFLGPLRSTLGDLRKRLRTAAG